MSDKPDRDFSLEPCMQFAELHLAICRGDSRTAKVAARELRKLGYEVTVTPARAAELARQNKSAANADESVPTYCEVSDPWIYGQPQDEIPPR